VALQYYAWALRVRRAVFGYKAVVVADTLYNMALLMKRIGRCKLCVVRPLNSVLAAGSLTESQTHFNDAAEILAQNYGATHESVTDARHQAARAKALEQARPNSGSFA
jgi:hypothetical protein